MGAAGSGAAGTGAAGTGAAGRGAAGGGAAAGEFNGLGAATFVAATCPGAGAGACWAGAMMLRSGAGSRPTVVWMPSVRAISSATTALMAATANAVPTSSTGRRRGLPSMTTVGALASSSVAAL
jgi:hypothetical protein